MQNHKIQANHETSFLITLCLSSDIEAIEVSTPKNLDWYSIVHIARVYGLSPLLYHKLNQLRIWSQCPEKIKENLRQTFGKNLQMSELQRRELVKISKALAKESIPVMPYKGCYLSQILYGDPYLRVSGDIDLIIPKKDVKKAWKILTEEMGYNPLLPKRGFVGIDKVNDYNFTVKTPGISPFPQTIEVHWEQVRSYNPLKIPMKRIWETAIPIQTWGVTFHEPRAPFLFLMLAIHAMDDNWPLKSLVDLATLSSVLSPKDREEVRREAQKWKLQHLLEETLKRIDHLKKGEILLENLFPSRKEYGKVIISRTLRHTAQGKVRLKYLVQVTTQPSFRDYDMLPKKIKNKAFATLIRPYRLLKEWLLK